MGMKSKMLQPEMDEVMASMQRHQKQGNREAAKAERNRMKRIRKLHGIYPSISMLNLLQMPLHITFMSMCNTLSYNIHLKPAMLTEGMLWFPDLTAPDPFGVLPILSGVINLLNILNSSTQGGNSTMRKMRKFIVFMPLISIPVQMTFPAAFNLYWIASSSIQLAILTAFRVDSFRHYLGVPNFLPGSKLEKANIGAQKLVSNEKRPEVFKHKPKTLKQKGMVTLYNADSSQEKK